MTHSPRRREARLRKAAELLEDVLDPERASLQERDVKAPEPAPSAEFLAELERRAPTIAARSRYHDTPKCEARRGPLVCELQPGHECPHSARSSVGGGGVAWFDEAPPAERGELVARSKFHEHSFPRHLHGGTVSAKFPRGNLSWKVCRASVVYRCVSADLDPRPRGHVDEIQPGEQYLRIAWKAESYREERASGQRSMRSRTVCRACALAYDLVTEEAPKP